MYDNELYSSDDFSLVEDDGKVYIYVKHEGYDINEFNAVIVQYPRVKITQFINLKSAITNGLSKFILVGEFMEKIEVTVSKDRFTAYGKIYLTDEEFEQVDQNQLADQLIEKANVAGIEFGIDMVTILGNIRPMEKFVIALGQQPIQGEDAKIHLYEIEDVHPEVYQDGKVNHYELNLINKVLEGEWVGERIEPTPGTPGRTVFGEIIPAVAGKQEKLIYDRKSIAAKFEEKIGKTILHAKRVGAVVYENGVLTVCNYLEIKGKVSFETGNIDFDGYVDVKDSIEDNFSVTADNDIQVMGDLGVGAVETITSREGSIYIRGGIAGQNKSVINCDGDLYTKFAADCTIICKGTVHIGFYALNCKIVAKEVILDSYNSKIIGGDIEADVRIYAGEIGSRAETYTRVSVKGFDRQDMRKEYDGLSGIIEKLSKMAGILKQKLAVFNSVAVEELSSEEVIEFEKLENEYMRCQKSLKVYTQRLKNYRSYLQVKGEGEIKAMKRIYPNVHLELKENLVHNQKDITIGTSYYLKDNRLVVD